MLAGASPSARIVVVLFNGGGLAIEDLVADSRVHAILEGFYPGVVGATAMAESLFGVSNRFGKLPHTLLAASFTNESNFFDLNMTDGVGRTYKCVDSWGAHRASPPPYVTPRTPPTLTERVMQYRTLLC